MKSIFNPFTGKLQKTPNNLTDIDTRSHTDLTDKGTNTHAQIDTALALDASHRSGAIMSHPSIEQNIMLNAFRTAIVGSLSVQKMVDGFTDEYEDETGVDTAGSTGESYDATNDLYKPVSGYQSVIAAESGLVSYWKMDNDWLDSKGTNHGTADGATFGTAIKGTASGSFDGINDYVAFGTDIPETVEGTVEIWFSPTENLSSSSGVRNMFGNLYLGPTLLIGWNVVTANGLEFGYHDGSWKTIYAGAGYTWTSGNIYHVVGTWGAAGLKLYVNNVLVASDATKTGKPNNTVGPWRLGSFSTIGWYKGRADELAVYNVALSTTQISDHYNAAEGTANMTLLSAAQTAKSVPTNARIVLFEEDVDAVTLGTHLKSYVSRDNGTTYTQITLSDEGDYDTNKRILTGTVDLSSQPSGTSMKYKIETLQNKNCKIHGTAMLWNS